MKIGVCSSVINKISPLICFTKPNYVTTRRNDFTINILFFQYIQRTLLTFTNKNTCRLLQLQRTQLSDVILDVAKINVEFFFFWNHQKYARLYLVSYISFFFFKYIFLFLVSFYFSTFLIKESDNWCYTYLHDINIVSGK